MEEPLKGEILAPDPVADGRDERGRFQQGHAGGARKGKPNTTTAELRLAIMNAFNTVGGESYLVMLAVTKPDLFVGLVGRILPLKVEPGEGEQAIEYRVIRRVPMIKK